MPAPTGEGETVKRKPTIAELEAILEEGNIRIEILPDGSVHTVKEPTVHQLEDILAPTGDALREAAQLPDAWEKRAADTERNLKSGGYNADETGRLRECIAGWRYCAAQLRTALASQPVETKGPWKAKWGRFQGDRTETDWWWVKLSADHPEFLTRNRVLYGPFTEPQARGVADTLNRLEPTE